MPTILTNILHWMLASIFFALGGIGLALPIIPQVPFFLLAIFFASKASPKFHKWIQKQKIYQKIITPIKKSIKNKQKLSWIQLALVKLLGIKS
ncbi:DUF454 family protein [Ligilactobacillus hayakitensis]|nr:DUF454 family protein [Ligilactobacillus hayakitensis]